MTTGQMASIDKEITVTNQHSVVLVLWNADDLTPDDELYRFPFSVSTLVFDPKSTSTDPQQLYVPLSMCGPWKTYWARGIESDSDAEYFYHINIRVLPA